MRDPREAKPMPDTTTVGASFCSASSEIPTQYYGSLLLMGYLVCNFVVLSIIHTAEYVTKHLANSNSTTSTTGLSP